MPGPRANRSRYTLGSPASRRRSRRTTTTRVRGTPVTTTRRNARQIRRTTRLRRDLFARYLYDRQPQDFEGVNLSNRREVQDRVRTILGSQRARTINRLAEIGEIEHPNKPGGFEAFVGDLIPDEPYEIALAAIPGGLLAKGGGRLAAKTLAKQAGRGPLRRAAAREGATGAGRQVTEQTAKGAQAAGGRVAVRVGERGKKAWKAHRPAVTSKAGRQLKRRNRAQNVSALLAANPVLAAPVVAGGATTVAALADNPGKTLGTTARAIPGIATSVIGLAKDAGTAALTGDTGPLEGQWEQQKNYYNLLRGLMLDENVQVEDPETGKTVTRTPMEIVQEDVGLIPALSIGLGIGGSVGRAGVRLPRGPLSHDARVGRLLRDLESGDRAKALRARDKLEQMKASRKDRRASTRHESERMAITKDRAERQFEREMTTRDGVVGVGRERLDRDLEKLNRVQLTDKVTLGDVVQFMGREGLADASQVRRAVDWHRKNLRDPSREIDDLDVSTRDVLDALAERPDVAADPRLGRFLDNWGAMQRERSIERHEERTQGPQNTPDPEDEAVRYQHLARAEGVPWRNERVPHELRGVTSVRPRQGKDVETQLRTRTKRLRKTAKRNRVIAAAIAEQQPKKAAKLEARALRNEQEAEQIEAVINRQRQAEALDRRAAKEDRAGNREAAGQLRREAQELRRADLESSNRLRDEFLAEAKAAQAKAQKREPIYFKESDVANRGPGNVLENFPSGRLPKKEQRRLGVLAKEGRIDEAASTLLENAYRERVSMELRRHGRDFLDENLLRENGKPLVIRGDEGRKRQRRGEIPPGYTPFPVQEFNRLLQRGQWDEAAGLIDNPVMKSVRESRHQGDRQYGYVPEAALKEFRAQMEPFSKGLKVARTAARLQSLGMLALSPAWFSYQLVASPLVAFASHPNPAAWVKALYRTHKEWRETPERDRVNFQAHYGGTTADTMDLRNVQMGMRPDTLRNMSSAAGVALRSPAARAGRAIWEQVQRGGPLIQANRKYEAKIRDLVAMIEMDKQIKNPQAVMRFAGSSVGLNDIVALHMKQLKGKSLREQIEFYNRNPEAMRQLTDAVNDAMGNWNALSKGERFAAAVTVFYPFLRFSLRWMFLTFPRRHPLKMAVLMNLAQSNAEELERLYNGAPSFFADWGNVVTHDSEGEPSETLKLSRIAPGSNAIVEALGEGGFNLPTLFAPTQPIVKTLVTAAAGQNPLTGREDPNRSKMELILRGILGLSVPTRSLAAKVGEESDYSKLFKAITGREGSFADYIVPRPTGDVERDREAARVSRLMDRAFGPENDGEARAELEDLLVKYGIRDDEESSSSSSSGGTAPWRGGSSSSSSGGTAPWK